MSETELYTHILAKYSRGDTRLFRINAGMAYQGRVIERTPNRLILSPWYPMRLAPEGWSDLIGWTSMAVAGDGGIDQAAIFTAIEGKVGRRKATPEQLAFIDVVRKAGGRAGIARSVEDAGSIIAGF